MKKLETKKTVLVIEDNELNREMISDILSDHYLVLQAENGKVGLEILEEMWRRISLILLDIQMPVMNGYEFLKEIKHKEQFKHIPIIVTTSSDTMNDEIQCLEMGASDFVTKPYNPDIVVMRSASMIRLSEATMMLSKVEYDHLTGLLSREFFFDHAQHYVDMNPEKQFDLVCMDIEAFKMVNDLYGMRSGDKVLQYVAQVFADKLFPDALCGRIGGDIFAMIMPHNEFGEYKTRTAGFRDHMKECLVPNLMAYFGVYSNISHNLPISTCCDNALLAIGKIKHSYDTMIAEYDESVRQKLKREQQIVDHMENALKEKQFKVFFQAKFDLDRQLTGGAEALVRWTHPEMGFIGPGEFIPLFEKNGFIRKLDAYMLEETCRCLSEWRSQGKPVVPISVNVSRVDFSQADLAEQIAAIADRYRIPRELIHLEVTESAYIENPQEIIDSVKKLQSTGFEVELDDFGSGYSSLNVLTELEPDVLKLDMSIVRNMDKEKPRMVLCHTLSMAQSLNMKVVAEGVETEEQASALREMGCTYAQGYYYSRPIAKEQFESYLEKQVENNRQE